MVTDVIPHDERKRLLETAAKLRRQAKEKRSVGQWIDAKRLETRAAIMEGKAKSQ
jgi:hypothetical protein